MKALTSNAKFLFNTFVLSICLLPAVSNSQSLPAQMFLTLRDSTTQADVVFHYPATTSLSLEGRNVKMLNSLIDTKTAADTLKKPDGFVMWLINGREFVTGDFFLNERESYFRFKKDTMVFVNRLTEQGANFFRAQKR